MTSMNIEDILIKAGEYDSAGHRLEELKLYEDGMKELLQDVQNESNSSLKYHYTEKIKELMSKVERIKNEIQNKTPKDFVVERMHIRDGETGYSYQSIFGNYLTDDVKKIDMQDPYLKEHYQFRNLVKFMRLVIQKCKNLKEIIITTQPNSTTYDEQKENFEKLIEELAVIYNISLNIKYSEGIHDGQIIFGNGYIFKTDRGLDIYKEPNDLKLGYSDFSLTQCKETKIDIFKTS